MFYKNKCNNVSANLLNVLMASQKFTTYTTYQKFGVSKIFFFFYVFEKYFYAQPRLHLYDQTYSKSVML